MHTLKKLYYCLFKTAFMFNRLIQPHEFERNFTMYSNFDFNGKIITDYFYR